MGMVLIEKEKYVNPDQVGYLIGHGKDNCVVYIQGREVSFDVSADKFLELINKEIQKAMRSR